MLSCKFRSIQLNSLRVFPTAIASRPLISVGNNFSSSPGHHASVVDCRGLSMMIGTFQEGF